MPIYEYQCRGCDARFEAIVHRPVDATCPSCGSGDLDRLLSTFAVSSAGTRLAEAPSACGTCGDPRGPGACSLD